MNAHRFEPWRIAGMWFRRYGNVDNIPAWFEDELKRAEAEKRTFNKAEINKLFQRADAEKIEHA